MCVLQGALTFFAILYINKSIAALKDYKTGDEGRDTAFITRLVDTIDGVFCTVTGYDEYDDIPNRAGVF